MATTLQSERHHRNNNSVKEHILSKSAIVTNTTSRRDRKSSSMIPLTVNTANATVPIIKPSELLNFSIAGGFSLCCVKDASHFGRAITPEFCDVSRGSLMHHAGRMLQSETGIAKAAMTTSKETGRHAKCCPSAGSVGAVRPTWLFRRRICDLGYWA